MSADTQVGGFDDGGERYRFDSEPDLFKALKKHDKNKLSFAELLSDLSTKPEEIDKNIQVINFRASKMVTSWRTVVDTLCEQSGFDSEEFINSTATIWMEDDRKLSNHMAELSGDDFDVVADGEIANLKSEIRAAIQLIRENSEEDDISSEVVSGLSKAYISYTTEDTEKFIQSLKNNQYSIEADDEKKTISPVENLRNILPQLGAHALDAAKIAAGMSLGIILASRFRKK